MSGPEERQSLDASSPFWAVHVARYLYAAPHVRSLRALDIACGTGYGLPILQAEASRVVGVEIDPEAARQARREAGNGGAHVIVGSGYNLPFRQASFDVITSFETIEHLEDRTRFLAELERVLVPGGLCIISTPNANHTQPINGKPRNPFHVYEYTPDELGVELRRHFTEVEMLGQVLDPRFKISPFQDEQQRLPRNLGTQTSLFVWRVLNKVGFARDPVSRALWGHSFFPTEKDYQFHSSQIETAPVLMAVCRAGYPSAA